MLGDVAGVLVEAAAHDGCHNNEADEHLCASLSKQHLAAQPAQPEQSKSANEAMNNSTHAQMNVHCSKQCFEQHCAIQDAQSIAAEAAHVDA